jgi:hypothetical protein
MGSQRGYCSKASFFIFSQLKALTPWSFFPQEFILVQLVQKFSSFHGEGKFIQCTQELTTGLCPEPVEFNSQTSGTNILKYIAPKEISLLRNPV